MATAPVLPGEDSRGAHLHLPKVPPRTGMCGDLLVPTSPSSKIMHRAVQSLTFEVGVVNVCKSCEPGELQVSPEVSRGLPPSPELWDMLTPTLPSSTHTILPTSAFFFYFDRYIELYAVIPTTSSADLIYV